MTLKVSAVLGEVVSEVARTELRLGGRGSMLRIAGFEREEATEIALHLQGACLEADGSPVRVLVGAAEPWPGLPAELLVPPGRTITSFRNDPTLSFVLIEVDGYSDAQSLQRVRSIDDSQILREAGDGQERNLQVLSAVWRQSGRADAPVPGVLKVPVADVFGRVSASPFANGSSFSLPW
jgi:hypothetical protein